MCQATLDAMCADMSSMTLENLGPFSAVLLSGSPGQPSCGGFRLTVSHTLAVQPSGEQSHRHEAQHIWHAVTFLQDAYPIWHAK